MSSQCAERIKQKCKGNEDNVRSYCVSELTPFLKEPWCFTGRVIGKNHVKHWKNLAGNGKLFDIFLVDKKPFHLKSTPRPPTI